MGDKDIDIGLSVCLAVRRPGETLSLRDIAHICGYSRTSVFNVEKRALNKLRRELKRRNITEDILI